MNKFHDSEFLMLESQYYSILKRLNLINGYNRFDESFRTFKTVVKLVANQNSGNVPTAWIQRYRNAIYDLTELKSIINNIFEIADETILREKVKRLIGGVSSPADESRNNSLARNTQFELMLYSELKESGLNCALKEPNPDILINVFERKYALECKRIYSMNSRAVEDSIKHARDQLIFTLNDEEYTAGIIAIDITRKLTNGNTYLSSPSAEQATIKLSNDIEVFKNAYRRLMIPSFIRDRRIIGVLMHMSVYTYITTTDDSSHGAYTFLLEVHSDTHSKELFNNAIDDILNPLSEHKAGSPLVITKSKIIT